MRNHLTIERIDEIIHNDKTKVGCGDQTHTSDEVGRMAREIKHLRSLASQLDNPNSNSVAHTLRSIAEQVERMTPTEFRDSLVKAGIIDADGILMDAYTKRG